MRLLSHSPEGGNPLVLSQLTDGQGEQLRRPKRLPVARTSAAARAPGPACAHTGAANAPCLPHSRVRPAAPVR